MNRDMAQAGLFYPAGEKDCSALLEKCLDKVEPPDILPDSIIAGIAPHAGWVYSGATAGSVYRAIRQMSQPKTFIIFGAVHVGGVKKASVWGDGAWKTPLGNIDVYNKLATDLVQKNPDILEISHQHHIREHSIEVLIPFIKHLFPQANIVPVMIPPKPWAHNIGYYAAELSSQETIAIGSTDMTHYGTRFGFTPMGVGESALSWVKEKNDRRMVDLMLNLAEEDVVNEAGENQNACGSGAIAATLAFAKAKGKKQGKLLNYTTSWDVFPEREIDSFVGYSGIVF